MNALRTWDNDKRCAECCNGDRCDDPTHYDRPKCPHCKGTGWALWTGAGRQDYAAYLSGRGTSEAQVMATLTGFGYPPITPKQASQQVLKAEAAPPDATDRDTPANASPVGGPMGAGEPAAAGPASARSSA